MKRFFDKTKRNPETGCLEWTAARDSTGYGSFKLDGEKVNAHRVAWRLAYGPVPAGLDVCHHCDNRLCVEPNHLFVGTRAENVADAVKKGRHSTTAGSLRGTRNPKARLNEVAVRVIRHFHAKGVSQRKLARLHGVDHKTISFIVHRKTWTHV